MACVENMRPEHADSDREEGEIVDELDDLSDISSEEEYLLRQRLQVLENYNNALERKEAKRTSICSGNTKNKLAETLDLSDVSVTNFDEKIFPSGDSRVSKSKNVHHKHRRRKDPEPNLKYREHKKKPYKNKKKIEPIKVISETSDEEDYEYRNKRRKLADAVSVNKVKADTSSLRSRLTKMIANSESYLTLEPRTEPEFQPPIISSKETTPENNLQAVVKVSSDSNPNAKDNEMQQEIEKLDLIDVSTDDDIEIINITEATDSVKVDPVASIGENNKEIISAEASDEDLELLRQHALKSKAAKTQETEQKAREENDLNSLLSEDDDDTELRLICLRSAFLKKAIEHKQKQKLEKKLSQTTLYDEVIANDLDLSDKSDVDNNTDIEAMDMEMGSDNENKEHVTTENFNDLSDKKDISDQENRIPEENIAQKNHSKVGQTKTIPKEKNAPREEDIEEDEDLLRAKLLTSLSKNLPLLVDSSNLDHPEVKAIEKAASSPKEPEKVVDEKKFIINTGGSDSEGEHEATKNLTKMHIKLSEQIDFQQKLDMFLKSARSEVEKTQLPDVVQQPSILPLPKTPQKFVPKAVNHLPKSEQIEYKNLVKRMAELEKVKQARQVPLPAANQLKPALHVKETLKPRNISIDKANLQQINHLDEQIALSRKKIAEESAKVLVLREQETKLSQKHKIVATELRNLTTAITVNKKQQKSAQIRLSKMRGYHQLLLKRSTIYSKTAANTLHRQVNKNIPTKLQKENAPVKNDLKSVKVSVVNDYKEKRPIENTEPMLSVQLDVTNNRKTVTLEDEELSRICEDVERRVSRDNKQADDYKSPLEALCCDGWNEDPNGVLCPFEVGGHCKDTNCKYLHPKLPTQ